MRAQMVAVLAFCGGIITASLLSVIAMQLGKDPTPLVQSPNTIPAQQYGSADAEYCMPPPLMQVGPTTCWPLTLKEGGSGGNPLWSWFLKYDTGPELTIRSDHFDVMHRHLQRFRDGRKVRLLLFGLESGGQIAMWRSYFGPDRLHLHGVDEDPTYADLYHDPPNDVSIVTGHEGDAALWQGFRDVANGAPLFDIILQMHKGDRHLTGLDEGWPLLKPKGVYISWQNRNLHNSEAVFWMPHALSLVRDALKKAIDLRADMQGLASMTCYDGVLALEKDAAQQKAPLGLIKGSFSVPEELAKVKDEARSFIVEKP